MCSTKQKQKHHHRPAVPTVNWREESIAGGSLKHVDLEKGKNGWASPPGDLFNLRGPNYFTKRTKIPSGAWLLQPAGVDWLRSNAKLDHVLARHDNRVMHALRKSHSEGKSLKTFILAVNLQVPGRDHHSAVFYFATNDDEPLEPGSLLYRFVNGDDSYRNSRFKILNRIVKGPWIVKAAVGNYSACILGKALNCYYHRGPNYFEIDVDIGSSAIASAILHLALGYVTSVTIDMGFLVESQTEEELPEKLFGAVRVCQMEMSSATFVDTTSSRKDNGGRSYFKWIELLQQAKLSFESSRMSQGDETTIFQAVAKFQLLERLRESKKNRNLLLTLFREAEKIRDHLKILLKKTEIERDELK